MRNLHEQELQTNGQFITSEFDIGYTFPGNTSNNFFNFYDSEQKKADVITETARLVTDSLSDLSAFSNFAGCLGRNKTLLSSHEQYRAIDGYGNNLDNPYWGVSETPFGRFGAKTYDDGVHSIRQSVTATELPSARTIAQEILLKAEKATRTINFDNSFSIYFVLYLTHDMANQVPVGAFDNGEEIRCCANGNAYELSKSLLNSACLPIAVKADDSFYKDAGARCLNVLRSSLASSPDAVQYGEIKNKATAFLDHSIIYEPQEAATNKIRSFENGKFRMSQGNVLPVNSEDNFLSSTERIFLAPVRAIWPSLFVRNHNSIAEQLSTINPQWNDEILFQEARRINIALYQYLVFACDTLDSIFGSGVNETYNADVDPSTTVEFTSAAYRFGHFFVQSEMLMVDENGNREGILLSDTLGNVEFLKSSYDNILRGLLLQPLNYDQYSAEVWRF